MQTERPFSSKSRVTFHNTTKRWKEENRQYTQVNRCQSAPPSIVSINHQFDDATLNDFVWVATLIDSVTSRVQSPNANTERKETISSLGQSVSSWSSSFYEKSNYSISRPQSANRSASVITSFSEQFVYNISRPESANRASSLNSPAPWSNSETPVKDKCNPRKDKQRNSNNLDEQIRIARIRSATSRIREYIDEPVKGNVSRPKSGGKIQKEAIRQHDLESTLGEYRPIVPVYLALLNKEKRLLRHIEAMHLKKNCTSFNLSPGYSCLKVKEINTSNPKSVEPKRFKVRDSFDFLQPVLCDFKQLKGAYKKPNTPNRPIPSASPSVVEVLSNGWKEDSFSDRLSVDFQLLT